MKRRPGGIDHYIGIIITEARRCRERLPPTSIYDMQDLIQEGVIIYIMARKSYDGDRASFSTYLTRMLKFKMSNLVKSEWYRSHDAIPNPEPRCRSEACPAHFGPMSQDAELVVTYLKEATNLNARRNAFLTAANGVGLRSSKRRRQVAQEIRENLLCPA